jgi:hypothetical protein
LTGAGSITELRTVTDVAVVAFGVNCALRRCTIGITLVVEKVAVVVKAHRTEWRRKQNQLLGPITGVESKNTRKVAWYWRVFRNRYQTRMTLGSGAGGARKTRDARIGVVRYETSLKMAGNAARGRRRNSKTRIVTGAATGAGCYTCVYLMIRVALTSFKDKMAKVAVGSRIAVIRIRANIRCPDGKCHQGDDTERDKRYFSHVFTSLSFG